MRFGTFVLFLKVQRVFPNGNVLACLHRTKSTRAADFKNEMCCDCLDYLRDDGEVIYEYDCSLLFLT